MKTLTALTSFNWSNKQLKEGDEFEVLDNMHADLLCMRKLAIEMKPNKQNYLTRDLTSNNSFGYQTKDIQKEKVRSKRRTKQEIKEERRHK